MKHRIALYLFLVATLCMGCGGRISMRQLQELEARVNDVPDSVLRVLTAADMPRWGEARALYALLTVQAQDKSYIDVADDSLICVATDYYAISSDARHRMLAFYYLSRVQYNMQAYAQSIISASRAEEAAITIGDDYYLGLIYRCMSESYNQTYNTTEELYYISKARECFERAGYENHARYAQLNTAKAYMGNGMFDEAEQICEGFLKVSSSLQDSTFILYNLSLYSNVSFLKGKYSIAKNMLLQLAEKKQFKLRVDDYCTLARIYDYEQKFDSALFSLNKAREAAQLESDSVYIYRTLYDMALSNKDENSALSYYIKIVSLQDSVTRAILQQSVATAHRDHYRNLALMTAERAAHDKRLLTICLFALFSISALAILYYREGNKRQEAELARMIESAHEIALTMSRQRDELTSMQKRIDYLFGEQFATLDRLVNTYLDHEGSKRNSTAILHELEQQISEFSSAKKIRQLEQAINETKQQIVARLREQIPNIRETEIHLFLYLCAGFSLRTISLLMNDKLENIYNKKSRFKSKIQRFDTPDKEDFLRVIS